MGIFCGVNV